VTKRVRSIELGYPLMKFPSLLLVRPSVGLLPLRTTSGSVRSLAAIARRESIAVRYVERLSRLAFTAPRIVEAICQGREPAELNAEALLKRIDLPLEWSAQLKALGID